MSSPRFLVDGIFESGETHLIAGPSGVGKSRWILPMLKEEWERGLPVLGHASHPVPWAYVAADRTEESARMLMESVEIDPNSVNIIPAWGGDQKTARQIVEVAIAKGYKMLLWEAIGTMPTGDSKYEVTKFLSALSAETHKRGITPIGIKDYPKMKANEMYKDLRQRVGGTSAWSYHTNTIILVERPESNDVEGTPERILRVMPKSGIEFSKHMIFDERGRLIVDENLLAGFDETARWNNVSRRN